MAVHLYMLFRSFLLFMYQPWWVVTIHIHHSAFGNQFLGGKEGGGGILFVVMIECTEKLSQTKKANRNKFILLSYLLVFIIVQRNQRANNLLTSHTTNPCLVIATEQDNLNSFFSKAFFFLKPNFLSLVLEFLIDLAYKCFGRKNGT